jgi:hypothetical protein
LKFESRISGKGGKSTEFEIELIIKEEERLAAVLNVLSDCKTEFNQIQSLPK